MVVAPGFMYDPAALTPGFPAVTTIDLGPRLRVFSTVGRWTPASLVLLDEHGGIITTIRLDLPPAGTVRGRLDAIAPDVVAVRLTTARDIEEASLAATERRIGIHEPELAHDRLVELGLVRTSSQVEPRSGESVVGADQTTASAINSSETSLDPNFGRVMIVGGEGSASTSSFTGVADQWDGPGDPSEQHWLSQTVRRVLSGDAAP
jgi:hypothetical protein